LVTNYHVAVQDLKEYDKKLKILACCVPFQLLLVKKSSADLLVANENDKTVGENTDIASFFDGLSCDDVAVSDAEVAALVFVAGASDLKCKERITVTCAKLEYRATKLCTSTLAARTSHYWQK
jgi:hypothetical protein